jgi:arginine decarboxylase
MDLANFFSAAEARTDRWRQMNAAGRAWEASIAQGKSDEKLHAEAVQLFAEIRPLEDYWAYPGPRLMATIGEAIEQHNAGVFARLVQKISNALLTGSYRYDISVWDPLQEGEGSTPDILPPDVKQGESHKPYFEVLVVTPNDPKTWERARNELKRLRRPEDLFNYEIVQVGSYEDGALGAIFNHNVQAVVLYDGFPFHSRHDLPVMREFLMRHLHADPVSIAPGALATTLARAIKNYRPELDIYLLTDRAVEKLAGSEEAAPIRRIFHNIEEVMEVHLSVLDGVNDRYDTPFFSNLKKYAQRPIGTFHALPIARGKSVFRSNWIRDMGQFYGTNLFRPRAGWTACSSPRATLKRHRRWRRGLSAARTLSSVSREQRPRTRSSCRHC